MAFAGSLHQRKLPFLLGPENKEVFLLPPGNPCEAAVSSVSFNISITKTFRCRCRQGKAMSRWPLFSLPKLAALRKPLLRAVRNTPGKTSRQLQGRLHETRTQLEKTLKQRNTARVRTSLFPQHQVSRSRCCKARGLMETF